MPAKAKPTKLHRRLHLQHHVHTGRMLHRKHTSYRSLALVLVVAGAFIIGLNMVAKATADTINVYAQLLATIPTESATITSPHDGDVLSKTSLIVTGTCPALHEPGSVAILDNGKIVGSAPCDSDDTFSLSIQITPGTNVLIARVFTITNQAGPDSPPVTITYVVPAPVESAAQAAVNAEPTHGPPLTVTIDEPFILFSPEKDAVWSGTMEGGRLPYRVHISWGDGTHSDYTVRRSGHQEFSHHYTQWNSHRIVLRVLDVDNRGVLQEYAAVTPYRERVSSILYTEPRQHYDGSLPIAIYGIYLLIVALIGWLLLRTRQREFAYAKVPVQRASARSTYIASKKRRKKNTNQ